MGPFHDQAQNMEFADGSIRGSFFGDSPNTFEEEQLRLDSAFSEFSLDEDMTDEGRLSRALQTWMPDHAFSSIKPMEKPPLQPIYSGRLGDHVHLKRSSSEDSIITKLSLFSCSSDQDSQEEVIAIRKKKKKKKHATGGKEENKLTWDQVAEIYSKKGGEFTRFMRAQNVMMMDTYTGLSQEEDILANMLPEDEYAALNRVGNLVGVNLIDGHKKCGSMTNIDEASQNPVKPKERVGSAGTKPKSKPINLEEIKQQRINERLAQIQRQKQAKNRRTLALRKRSSLANLSRMSISSDISSDFAPNTPSVRSITPEPEERVLLWKGDREILEMDLRKGLTARAKTKIRSTTVALERVTGFGEDNGLQKTVGRHEEFPFHVEDDYAVYPKIAQRIRISPHLSNVIQTDIKVRMGRPRYHEIRVRDLEMWNRGQTLGRYHTNLKVFNWLFSLKEDKFEKDIECVINDSKPSKYDDLEILHVESADEPDIKPLYLKNFKLNNVLKR